MNLANQTLLGGRVISSAIHEAAGPRLSYEWQKLNGCETDEVYIRLQITC